MANFLNVSSPAAYQQASAEADAVTDSLNRDRAAYGALTKQYGPQAGNPSAWQTDQSNALAAQINPLKVQQAQLEADQAKRADAAWQGQHALAYIKARIGAGDTPEAAFNSLTPDTYAAMGVTPDHVAGLINAVKADPTSLDKLEAALAPDADKSKLVGTQPYVAKDASGNTHLMFPTVNNGQVSYSEGAIPAGYTLTGETPAQAAAAQAKAAQAAAAAPTNLGSNDVAAALKTQFPGITVTSTVRDAAHNAAVGGVPNSDHLFDRAVDFVKTSGMTTDAVKSYAAGLGLPNVKVLDEGTHYHVQWGGAGDAKQDAQAKLAAAKAAGVGTGGLLNPEQLSKAVDFLRSGGTVAQLGVPSGQAGAPQRAQLLKAQMQAAVANGDSGAAMVAARAHGAAVTQYQRGLDNLSINSPGGQRKAFDAIAGHADVADGLIDALHNGSQAQISAAKNAWAKAFGSPAPTNLSLVFTALAGETAKAVANNTSVFDQKEYLQNLPINGAQVQQHQAVQTIRDLAKVQLSALRQQAGAADSTSYFDQGLSPAAKKLVGIGGAAPQSHVVNVGGKQVTITQVGP